MQPLPLPAPHSGVSSCYVFKSRLQEYAQKVNLSTPVYETTKEGPSHEPTFRSTVILDDVRYDSLLGFFNRKAAEQSAAEVALLALSEGISPPVHETGLCKNLLQEYAQKMGYAIPLYECQIVEMEESRGKVTFFSCTVTIGGIRYIGAAAKTKKEAEIKAARTALLAIQASDPSSNLSVKTDLTVLPCKKRGPETLKTEDVVNPPKPKKGRLKKKPWKKHLKSKTGLHNDKLRISEPLNISGANAVEPQGAVPTEAVPEEIRFQLEASNLKSGLNDNKLGIAEEPNVFMTVAVKPQVSGTEVDPQVETVPEKTQFQLKASNFKSDLNDNKLEIAENPIFTRTDAVESQVVANVNVSQVLISPSLNPGNYISPVAADGCGSSFIGEIKEVAVPNLPTGNGNYNECGSEAMMPSSGNSGNHTGLVEGISCVGDVCGGSCFSEVKEEVAVVGEMMQAGSDTA